MDKDNARTRLAVNAANIAAWHRKIRKAGSRAARLEKEQEHLKLMVAALDIPEVKVVPPPPAPVVTSQGMQLGVAQTLVDAGDFVSRGQYRAIISPAAETPPPPSQPPPINWEDPVTAAVMVETRKKAEAAPKVLQPGEPAPQILKASQSKIPAHLKRYLRDNLPPGSR